MTTKICIRARDLPPPDPPTAGYSRGSPSTWPLSEDGNATQEPASLTPGAAGKRTSCIPSSSSNYRSVREANCRLRGNRISCCGIERSIEGAPKHGQGRSSRRCRNCLTEALNDHEQYFGGESVQQTALIVIMYLRGQRRPERLFGHLLRVVLELQDEE